MQRTCIKCWKEKDVAEFPEAIHTQTGAPLKNFSSRIFICRECAAKAIRKSSKRRYRLHYYYNTGMSRKNSNKHRDDLSDLYITQLLSVETRVSRKIINDYPELIKAKRVQLKLRRLSRPNDGKLKRKREYKPRLDKPLNN